MPWENGSGMGGEFSRHHQKKHALHPMAAPAPLPPECRRTAGGSPVATAWHRAARRSGGRSPRGRPGRRGPRPPPCRCPPAPRTTAAPPAGGIQVRLRGLECLGVLVTPQGQGGGIWRKRPVAKKNGSQMALFWVSSAFSGMSRQNAWDFCVRSRCVGGACPVSHPKARCKVTMPENPAWLPAGGGPPGRSGAGGRWAASG